MNVWKSIKMCGDGFVLQMSQALKQGIYLLKDICKLAQNIFLQTMESGYAAGERKKIF